MIGYVKNPISEKLNLFSFQESEITIYNNASSQNKAYIKKTCLNVISDYDAIVGIDIEKNHTVVFFVSQIPFSQEPFFWTSTKVEVYHYLVVYDELCMFDCLRFRFPELNSFIR